MRYVAIDIETIGLDICRPVIWMISVTEGRKTKVHHDCWGMKICPPEVKKILLDPSICKIIHSSIFDCTYIEMAWGIKIRNVWDTDLCETVILGVRIKINRKNIEEGSADEKLLKKYSTALKYVLPRYGFKKPKKEIRSAFIDRPPGRRFTPEEITYAEDDTKDLPAIQKMQEYILIRDELIEVALLENKVAERYHDMKVRGIGFDPKIWAGIADQDSAELKRRLALLPRAVDNWNSPAQVKKYFRSKGIHIPSFDDLDTVYLQSRNKDLGNFIATRELTKCVGTYGMNWFKDGYIDPDGRVRTHMTQIINTGRNSSSDPNLQQLPGSGNNDPLRKQALKLAGWEKKKPQHRMAFVPKKGNVFVIGDFSGQEIGIMAAASGEDLWINALLRHDDVHSLTAYTIDPSSWGLSKRKGCVFPKKCECPEHKELREPSKINNFMQAYGGGAEKLAAFTGMPILAATAFCAAHRRATPKLTYYLQQNGIDAINTGVSYSADPYRRRRVLMGEEAWQIKNQGKNNPIQSAGANMLKLALCSIPWEYVVVLVIHDEIILEVPKKDAAKASKMLKQIMEKSADYITGIKGLVTVKPRVEMNIMKD